MSKKGADIDSALCHGCSKVPSGDHVFKCPSCKHNFCNDCTLTCATECPMCYEKLCPNCINKECPHCCRRYCGICDHDMWWETCWQCKEEACRHCTEHNGVTFWDHLYINSIFVCYDCMSSEWKHNFCKDCTLTCDTEWMCYAKLCPKCNVKECPQDLL